MERRHHSQRQQRRNHFSSSSSSNQSRSNNRFSFPKSSSNSSSSSSSANDVRDRRRETQEQKQEEAIVGTCPFMCPGKVPNLLHIILINLLFIIHLTLFIHSFLPSFPLIWFNNFIIVLLQTNPEAERLQRQRLRDLAVFERLHGDPRNSSPALAVKKVAYFHFKLVLLLLC